MPDQEIEIPIVGGLDEKTDSRLTARLITAENCSYAKSGALSKRYGYRCVGPYNVVYNPVFETAGISGTSTPPAPELLASLGQELVRIGGGELCSYRVTGETDWIWRDRVPNCIPMRTALSANPGLVVDADCCARDDLIVYAYTITLPSVTGTDRWYICADVVDASTGLRVYSKFPVESSTGIVGNPKVVYFNGLFHVFWRTPGTIDFRRLYPATLIWGPIATLKSGLRTASNVRECLYDVMSASSDGEVAPDILLAVYELASGVPYLRWEQWDSSLSSGGDHSFGPFGLSDYHDMAIAYEGGESQVVAVAVSPGATANVYARGWDVTDVDPWTVSSAFEETLSTASPAAPASSFHWQRVAVTPVPNGRTIAHPYRYLVSWSLLGFGGYAEMKWLEINEAGTATTAKVLNDASTISVPFVVGTRTYQLVQSVASADDAQASYFVIDLMQGVTLTSLSPIAVEAAVAVDQVTSGYSRGAGLSKVGTLGGSERYLGIIVTGSGPGTTAAEALTLTFDQPQTNTQQYGRVLGIGGGLPSVYDGCEVFEMGIAHVPTSLTLAKSDDGEKTHDGIYSVIVIFERVDAAGNIYRSAPSPAVSITLSGTTSGNPNTKITVTVDNVALTNFASQTDEFLQHIAAVAYCTSCPGAGLTGDTYYRDTSYIIPSDNSTGDPLTFELTTSDASIQSKEILYSTGGPGEELVNRMPPAAQFIHLHKNALVLGGTDDDRIWISKPLIPGEGPGFNGLLTIDPFDGGRVTGLATLDGDLVVFKSDGAFTIAGDMPNALGDSSLSEPVAIPGAVGCTDARSIATTPLGIVFQSRDGMYLLSRSREFVPIGKEVEDVAGTSALIGASVIPQQAVVRFALDSGTRLLDLDMFQSRDGISVWTTHVVKDHEDEARPPASVRSAIYHDGAYYWIDASGHLYKEATDIYYDEASNGTPTWVGLHVKTGWIKVSGLQGYTRCRRVGVLGRLYAAAGINLSLYLDYSESAQTRSFAAEVVNAASLTQVQTSPHPQKCEAFQVEIVDTPPEGDLSDTDGRGIGLTGIRATVDVMPGQRRLPKAQRS